MILIEIFLPVAFSADGDTVLWRTSANGVLVSRFTNAFTAVSSLPSDVVIASDKKNVSQNGNIRGWHKLITFPLEFDILCRVRQQVLHLPRRRCYLHFSLDPRCIHRPG
jgi:hypothetical protein